MKIISKLRIFSERIYENIDTFKKFRNNLGIHRNRRRRRVLQKGVPRECPAGGKDMD